MTASLATPFSCELRILTDFSLKHVHNNLASRTHKSKSKLQKSSYPLMDDRSWWRPENRSPPDCDELFTIFLCLCTAQKNSDHSGPDLYIIHLFTAFRKLIAYGLISSAFFIIGLLQQSWMIGWLMTSFSCRIFFVYVLVHNRVMKLFIVVLKDEENVLIFTQIVYKYNGDVLIYVNTVLSSERSLKSKNVRNFNAFP